MMRINGRSANKEKDSRRILNFYLNLNKSQFLTSKYLTLDCLPNIKYPPNVRGQARRQALPAPTC